MVAPGARPGSGGRRRPPHRPPLLRSLSLPSPAGTLPAFAGEGKRNAKGRALSPRIRNACLDPPPMPSSPAAEAARRRTFAIISHPDAGKTTLTEHLLLAGGAIRAAGAVRARGEQRRTTSDWMKIERERGISVSASAMTFDHAGLMFNLLDTPGHEGLLRGHLLHADRRRRRRDGAGRGQGHRAADAEGGGGLPPARASRSSPSSTRWTARRRTCSPCLDEIATKLAPRSRPALLARRLGKPVQGGARHPHRPLPALRPPCAPGGRRQGRPQLQRHRPVPRSGRAGRGRGGRDAGAGGRQAVRSEASFPRGPYDPGFLRLGERHFGVAEGLLEGLGYYAPPPKAGRRRPPRRPGDPCRARRSGGLRLRVFKVQANIDPGHRDRIAFLRLDLRTVRPRHEVEGGEAPRRQISVNSPVLFFASERELAEEAFAGDVIGIPNHGVLRVGYSLLGERALRFAGLPKLRPRNILRRLFRCQGGTRRGQSNLKRALEGNLAEEGVTQLFRPNIGADFIVGVVGQLQFEVMADRLAGEYGLDVVVRSRPLMPRPAGSPASVPTSRTSPPPTAALSRSRGYRQGAGCSWPSRRGRSATSPAIRN